MASTRRPRLLQCFGMKRLGEIQRAVFAVMAQYVEFDLDIGEFEEMADRVSEILPSTLSPRQHLQVVSDSLISLLETTLDRQTALETAARLAGNAHTIRTGIPAPPWVVQKDIEWAPVQVLDFMPDDKKEREGGMFRFRILAGTACPLVIGRWWSAGFCRALSHRVGFTWPRLGLPMRHIAELVQLRLAVELIPKWSRSGSPGFERVACPASFKEHNKVIIGYRNRVFDKKPWDCPQGFKHYCHVCSYGYDKCKSAVRPVTQEE